jgi:hypothetical protein
MQLSFLVLVQAAYREAGFVGEGPVAVANQVGRKGDVVRWVQQAFEEIQGMRTDWSFDWATGSFSLTPAKDVYDTVVDFGITAGVRDFSRSPAANYAYPTAQGVNGRIFMGFYDWSEYRGLTPPPADGTSPTIFTLRPDGKVVYYPRPTVACTVVHEYTMMPQVLTADADVPRMPARFHMVIAWKAVMIGCGKTKDFARFDTAEENFERLMEAMVRECTPKVLAGQGPLA